MINYIHFGNKKFKVDNETYDYFNKIKNKEPEYTELFNKLNNYESKS